VAPTDSHIQSFRSSPSSSRRRKVLRAIGAGFLGAAVVVGTAEVALWSVATWHDRERSSDEAIDSTVSSASSPESKIIFVGNSHTRGAGLPLHQSFPSQYDRRLRESSTSWRALNLGRTNYNSTQIRESLPGWMDETRARVVVAMLGEANLWNRVGQDGLISALQSRSRLLNFLSLVWLRHRDADARAWRALGIVEPNFRGPGNLAPHEWSALYLDDLERLISLNQELRPRMSEVQRCRWRNKLELLLLELRADLQAHIETDRSSGAHGAHAEALQKLSTLNLSCDSTTEADAVAQLLSAERLWTRASKRMMDSNLSKGDSLKPPSWLLQLRQRIQADSSWRDVMQWMLTLNSLEALSVHQRRVILQNARVVDPTHSLAAQLLLNELMAQGDWPLFMQTLVEFQRANPLSAQFAPAHFRNVLLQRAPRGVLEEFDQAQAQLLSWRPEASALYTDLNEEKWKSWIQQDLQAILRLVEERGATLVVQGYPPYRNPSPDRPCRPLDTWLKEFATENNLSWIDTCAELQMAFANARKLGSSREAFFLTQYGPHDDHLNERGYSLVAELLERELRPVLNRRTDH
jgi:hypothetical protein